MKNNDKIVCAVIGNSYGMFKLWVEEQKEFYPENTEFVFIDSVEALRGKAFHLMRDSYDADDLKNQGEIVHSLKRRML